MKRPGVRRHERDARSRSSEPAATPGSTRTGETGPGRFKPYARFTALRALNMLRPKPKLKPRDHTLRFPRY